jgi:hypothetical protein
MWGIVNTIFDAGGSIIIKLGALMTDLIVQKKRIAPAELF